MRSLLASLREADAALYPVLAKRWQVDISNKGPHEVAQALNDAMLDAARAETVWQGLADDERGALQTLLGAGGKMALPMFERLYGEIRKMGAGRIEREKPHENPASVAEALYYRGLIAEGFEQAASGARPIVYIPTDLAAVLPAHRTGYDHLDVESDLAQDSGDFYDEDAPTLDELDPDTLENVRPADTTIVDDMTTLLAYLQLHSARLEGDPLASVLLTEADARAVMPHLVVKETRRLAFLLEIGISAQLIEVTEGRAYPRRAEARRWLEDKRAAQLKTLVDAWRESPLYRELWHVPGLFPEPTGWPYDPVTGRRALSRFLRDYVPRQGWWPVDDFIMLVKEEEPDFQRPAGDYESWYIRSAQGDYLTGFESWDAVEGALLEFYLHGPLHWLGMVDLAEDAARLTAYGRSFAGGETWPAPAEPDEKIVVRQDGMLLVSRRVSRIERFQLARFTSWQSGATLEGAPYVYRLTPQSIHDADGQGINTGHIAAFLTRLMDEAPLPKAITNLLDKWQSGPAASVTVEQLLVLRTTAPETLDFILETPALRRYLGARLGPMAAVVRADQWEALRDALGERGIQVEILG